VNEAARAPLSSKVEDHSTGESSQVMNHPNAIRPEEHAVFNPEKMGKATIFQSDRILVGLNAFEPGQEHRDHAR
jgi:hypothetical protein